MTAALNLRSLGRTGLQITPMGIGTWAIGGGNYEFGWGSQDDQASERAIRTALDAGLNWIDTAPAYGLGRAETLIGRVLADTPVRPLVFTKCSRLWHADGTFYSSLEPASIRRELEGSLARLGIDRVDLYQVHRPWPRDDLAAGWETLRQLQDEGLVSHIGVSYVTVEDLHLLESIAPVEAVQPEYNLLRRDIETDVLPWCADRGVGVVAYSPMASGLLTGAFDHHRVANLPDDDWRKHDPQFGEPQLSRNLAVANAVRRVAEELGTSPGAVAIAWVLRHPAVSAAIVGFRSADQFTELRDAMQLELSPTHVADLERESAS